MRSNNADPRPDGWAISFYDDRPCPVCGETCKRAMLPVGQPLVYVGDGNSRTAALRSQPATASSRAISWLARFLAARGRPVRVVRDAAPRRRPARGLMALLVLPQPYDIALKTQRFRTVRAVTSRTSGTTALCIESWPAGEQCGDRSRCGRVSTSGRSTTRPVAWCREAARRGVRARAVPRLGELGSRCSRGQLNPGWRGFRPPVLPDPFECLVTSISAQQVSLRSAVAIRNRLVERFGVQAGPAYAFPDPRARRGGDRRRELFELGFLKHRKAGVRTRPRPQLLSTWTRLRPRGRRRDLSARLVTADARPRSVDGGVVPGLAILARPRAWPAGDLVLRKAARSRSTESTSTSSDDGSIPFQNLSAHYLLTGMRVS